MINPIRSASLATLFTLFTLPALANGDMPGAGDHMSAQLPPASAPCANCCDKSPAGQYYKTGFYAGGQVGYVHMDADWKGSYTNAQAATTPFSHHSDPDGVVGDVFLGGRFVFNNCIVAGMELSGSLLSTESNHDVSFNNNTRHFNIKQSRRFGFTPSFMAGYIFADRWMVYGRLGLAVGYFHTRIFDLDPQQNVPISNINYSHTETKLGFSSVLGVECGFTSTMSARAEVGAEIYQKFAGQKTIRADNTVLRTSFTPSFYTAKVGVVVKM